MKLLGHDKIVVGYDINDKYAQISYCIAQGDDVRTLSSVAGEEVFNIPTVLCKKEGVNQWYYGNEAIRYAQENQGILVTNLLSLAMDEEPVQIEGNSFEPVALLALFVKRTLGMLSQVSSFERIMAITVTCEKLDRKRLAVLNQVMSGIRLKTDKIFFQSYTESFFYYMLRQPEELHRHKTLLCEYGDRLMRVYDMENNHHTNPTVVFVKEREIPFPAYEPMPQEETLGEEMRNYMDEEFLKLATGLCSNQMISSVYLIGEHFSEDWMKESLRYLCKGRRVFQGNNLYSKGACYGVLERLWESEEGQKYVFLGNDKLKANVGMKILRRGEESYYALLDAGVNWFEAKLTQEFYLQEDNRIELMITSLVGSGNKLAQIILENLPEGICRLRLHLYMSDDNHLQVEIEDLGFGTFRQSTGHVWKEEIVL